MFRGTHLCCVLYLQTGLYPVAFLSFLFFLSRSLFFTRLFVHDGVFWVLTKPLIWKTQTNTKPGLLPYEVLYEKCVCLCTICVCSAYWPHNHSSHKTMCSSFLWCLQRCTNGEVILGTQTLMAIMSG